MMTLCLVLFLSGHQSPDNVTCFQQTAEQANTAMASCSDIASSGDPLTTCDVITLPGPTATRTVYVELTAIGSGDYRWE